MRTMEIAELEKHVREVLRQVQESGETIEVVNDHEVVALLTPAHSQTSIDQRPNPRKVNLDDLAARIGAHVPERVDAVEAIREIRREL